MCVYAQACTQTEIGRETPVTETLWNTQDMPDIYISGIRS